MPTINYISFLLGVILIILSVIMIRKKTWPKFAIILAIIGLMFILGPVVDPEATFPQWFNGLLFSKLP